MAVYYNDVRHQIEVSPEYCEGCGGPLCDTDCDAPGCDARWCPNCGSGCDKDVDPGGVCNTALVEEPPEVREHRINEGRAAFGLPPRPPQGFITVNLPPRDNDEEPTSG